MLSFIFNKTQSILVQATLPLSSSVVSLTCTFITFWNRKINFRKIPSLFVSVSGVQVCDATKVKCLFCRLAQKKINPGK